MHICPSLASMALYMLACPSLLPTAGTPLHTQSMEAPHRAAASTHHDANADDCIELSRLGHRLGHHRQLEAAWHPCHLQTTDVHLFTVYLFLLILLHSQAA
jgi:hypothetical protein